VKKSIAFRIALGTVTCMFLAAFAYCAIFGGTMAWYVHKGYARVIFLEEGTATECRTFPLGRPPPSRVAPQRYGL
jgi:hypothetical protein